MDVRATVERLGREHVGKSWWADLAEALVAEFEPVVAERDRLRVRLAELAPEEEWRCLFLREREIRDRLQAELSGVRHTLKKAYRRGDVFARRLARVTDPQAAERVDRQLHRLRQLEQQVVPRLIEQRDRARAALDREKNRLDQEAL